MSAKTLVIGDTDSIWIKSFIEEVLIPLGHDVYVQNDPTKTSKFEEFYIHKNVTFVGDYSLNSLIMKIPKVRVLYKQHKAKKALKNSGTYDNIVAIFVTPFHLELIEQVMTKKTKLFTWFIGSDLMRIEKNTINRLKKKLCELSPYVICSSMSLKKLCFEQFGIESKVIDFGNSQLPCIDIAWDVGVSECKRRVLKTDVAKTTICVGYNASSGQQHIKVLNTISSLPQIIKDNIHLIIPMTYNGGKEYIDNVKNVLAQSGVDGTVITDYMGKHEMAELWVASDVFVHAQVSDALSASLLESIYAASYVINGAWLVYPELESWGINITSFDSFEELRNVLNIYLEKKGNRERTYSKVLFDYSSWDACRNRWSQLMDHNTNG